jgi:hypothetical protein
MKGKSTLIEIKLTNFGEFRVDKADARYMFTSVESIAYILYLVFLCLEGKSPSLSTKLGAFLLSTANFASNSLTKGSFPLVLDGG